MNISQISVLCMMCMAMGCSTQKTKTDSDTTISEHMVGAYTNHRSISSEEKSLFETTYHGDTRLTPVKVATQVVAGTNYSFICKDKIGNTYEVIIYEPLPGQGAPEVSSITKK